MENKNIFSSIKIESDDIREDEIANMEKLPEWDIEPPFFVFKKYQRKREKDDFFENNKPLEVKKREIIINKENENKLVVDNDDMLKMELNIDDKIENSIVKNNESIYTEANENKIIELDSNIINKLANNLVKVKGDNYFPEFTPVVKTVNDLEVLNKKITVELWKDIFPEYETTAENFNDSIVNVSVLKMMKFCNKLSEIFELEKVYDLNDEILKINQIGGNSVSPSLADFNKTEGFRLPTEIEWEYLIKQNNYFTGDIWECCFDTFDSDIIFMKNFIYSKNDLNVVKLRQNMFIKRRSLKIQDGENNVGFRIVRSI